MATIEVELIKPLGKGAFGQVDLVSAFSDGTPIAGGQLACKWAVLPNSDSILKESRVLSQFTDCPRIVKYYGNQIDFREEEKSWVHEMYIEFADGGTLLDVMRRAGGRISSLDHVRAYTRMILEGLECVHNLGYAHCDIKPENILAFSGENLQWELKLADFGLAKEPWDKMTTLKPRGTPAYQSPDSANGVITPGMDIWAVGCVVYEMLTGKMLWEDWDWEEIYDELAFGTETPKLPVDLCECGKHFLTLCFERHRLRRPSASTLLSHPWLSDCLQKELSIFRRRECFLGFDSQKP